MLFNSLGSLASHLMRQSAVGYRAGLGQALKDIGKVASAEVQREIGEYQSAIGPYPSTEPLAASTIETKLKQGLGNGGPDTPLYATGAFQGDVGFADDKGSLSVDVGTNKSYIAHTELGTSNMPPRPVFGPSALRVLPKMQNHVLMYAAAGITGISISGFTKQDGVHTEII